METRTRLHPLLTAAAISVTVFSALGVGALTGLIPMSLGSHKQATPLLEQSSLQIPAEVAKPVEPAITHPVQAKKTLKRAAAPRTTAPITYNEFAQVEPPKPAVQPGSLATIQAVREVKDQGQHTGLGPIAGGIAGAVLGDQVGGKGTTRKVITVLGAAGGAYAGREIEKQARATKHWEIDVRRDDGQQETVRSDVAPPYQPGERVRLLDGRLQPA